MMKRKQGWITGRMRTPPRAGTALGKALEELKHEFPYLSNLDIHGHATSKDFTFLLVPRRHRPMLVGKNGITADALAMKLGRRARIIAGNDEHEIVEEVLYPVKVAGVDKIFSPDCETLKVRISQDEAKRLILTKREAEKVLTKLLSKKTVVELE